MHREIDAGTVIPPGGGCALPGLRSYDLSLIYSPLLLKLPVLAASKSLRRSRQAGGTGGGGDWPPPVCSLRRKRHNAEN
ncbi:hypothetical protein EC587_14425 [Klebsiella quasipneumoniae subsp. quasipneumoniae]|nr:hypothetical protein EXU05_01545 [Klebsiella quasipneumoniae subsp. quasipneumoniae]TBP65227.1 hypothetical protein EXT99_21560 [Klebsiella quasipneumoniae subsp. quasipneumoniae]TBQ08919.1 hypothetical protein EXU07_01910 [Klebsiella quasipneumoniae subsp. quasipneumoniae]TBQ70987.1 hypothetical protein EXU11_00970 [Klebsiella quasipneumoniae subsp. quasipneumoniae]TPB68223.1 hypothetical protein EC587_14425 [Klebsiella quasipneumoniae subsp. quasipneumoniae]